MVRDVGFSPGTVTITAVGALAKKEGRLVLEVPAVPAKLDLVLEGGGQELQRQAEAAERKVRVKGTLQTTSDDQPPSVTVEEWEPVPPSEIE